MIAIAGETWAESVGNTSLSSGVCLNGDGAPFILAFNPSTDVDNLALGNFWEKVFVDPSTSFIPDGYTGAMV